MNYKWRKRAETQLTKAVTFCTKTFGKRIAQQFIGNVDHQVRLISAHPHIGPLEPLLNNRRHSYRSLVVHEHFKLIYYIDEKKEFIYIVALWDIRREPEALVSSIQAK